MRNLKKIKMSFGVGVLALSVLPVPFLAAQQGAATTNGSAGQATVQSGAGATSASAAAPAKSTATTSTATTRRRRRTRKVVAPQRTPIANQVEQPNSPEEEESQREQDDRVLARQEAASQRQQQEQEKTVAQHLKIVRAQQNEPRIQNAPGPAQTGVAPGVPPIANGEEAPRIQDAPGPTQTLAPPTPATAEDAPQQ